MIDIYAIYFKNSNGTINTGKKKIQAIPAASQDEIYLLNPTVKVDMGNAESMDFSVQAGTAYYDSFIQFRTYIQVVYDGTTIFYGRVLTIDEGAFGSHKIHCEGALSILNDSYFPGKPDKSRVTETIYEHMSEIIKNHNQQLNDSLKTFALGEVPGNYTSSTTSAQRISNKSREFGSSSWTQSKSLLEDLKSHYGGHFRTRYSGNKIYLDWMNHYFRSTVNSQTIEVAKNLIDISGTTEVNNIFTVVIPIGKSETGDDKVYISYNGRNYITVPEVRNFYSDSALNSGYHRAEDYKNAISNYGRIFKTVEIQEASTSSDLLQKAAEWIKENYQGNITSFSVKAIDFRQIGENTDKILAGDRVKIIYMVGTVSTEARKVETTLTCTSVTYDLYNPENNQYSFGIPANSLSKNYGVKSTKSSQKASSPPAYTPSYDPEPEDEYEKWRKAVYAELKKHKTWYKSTGNVETGPENRANEPNKQKIWHAHESMTNGKTNYELWIPNAPHYIGNEQANNIRVRGWDRDGQGRPLGAWVVGTEEQLNIKYLRAHYLFEYMVDEHDIDLTTQLSVKMPSSYIDEEGDLILSNLTPVVDPETGETIRDTMSIIGEFDSETGLFSFFNNLEFGAFDPENGIFNFLNEDGTGYISKIIDGVYHYFALDPNNPGQFVEITNIRDLHIRQENSENFIGTVVEEGYADENGNIISYKFGQEILKNAYEQGDIVVAHVDGDKLLLGSENTKWSYNVASRVNNVWVQPSTWVTENGVKKQVFLDAGGIQSYRGYYDESTGEFVKQEVGNIGPNGEKIITITGNVLWDNNTLRIQGGIVTGKVGNDYVSFIKSDRLVIGNGASMLKVTDALVQAGVLTSGTLEPQALVANAVYTLKINSIEGRIDTLETDSLKTRNLYSALSLLDSVYAKVLTSTRVDAADVAIVKHYVVPGQTEYETRYSVQNCFSHLKVVAINSYQYKMQYKKLGTSESEAWTDLPDSTFNGASLLTGSWAGGIFTVKSDPENSLAVAVPPGTVSTTSLKLTTTGNVTKSSKNVIQTVKVQWRDLAAEAARPGMGPQYSNTGYEEAVTIDASSVFTDGVYEGYGNALSAVGITTASNTVGWPTLRLATSGNVTVSGKNVSQTVKVQWRDTVAEAADPSLAPYYVDTTISGTVSINASKVFDNGNLNGYSEASGNVTVNGTHTVSTSHTISMTGTCTIVVPYYNASSGSPKSTLSHKVTVSATRHTNCIESLNFFRDPSAQVKKIHMYYYYQGTLTSAGEHHWFYRDMPGSYTGNLYTYYT